MPKFRIDFMGKRKIMFAISITLVLISIGALAIKGLNFGIEFQGGTVIDITNAQKATEAQVRDAFQANGIGEPEVQTTADGGFIVRTTESDPQKANAVAVSVSKEIGASSTDVQVTTIGPGWGKTITDRALLALALSLLAILVYISLRFAEWKMAIAAIIALVHDFIITLGIYALLGREVTPNTLAALLAILGYSLYDTIVVFHRIRENSQYLVKQTFLDMATDSINQVLTRSISTSLTALIPVVSMLIFGGETLKDFAFALTIGLISGAYSSIAVAAPIYAVWKSSEPKYKALAKKYAAQSS
jgi:SecD/SecF fusion protein